MKAARFAVRCAQGDGGGRSRRTPARTWLLRRGGQNMVGVPGEPRHLFAALNREDNGRRPNPSRRTALTSSVAQPDEVAADFATRRRLTSMLSRCRRLT